MVWTLTCQPNCFQKQSTWGYYKHLYADEICCLCTSWRFGSYLYTILLASLGIALILADICRTVTNGPLPVCQARQDHSYNKCMPSSGERFELNGELPKSSYLHYFARWNPRGKFSTADAVVGLQDDSDNLPCANLARTPRILPPVLYKVGLAHDM
ncbi:uncharacterized protein LOC124363332 [Homalodisca vitripennis]|uniref:uncharacterized protein LOC124363332 n=1 Tax=Homalodisca vitripennis TaxID=197043 RepID=UPI001EE9D335|nr:uncharacterized protein LOC124363332 [Homalodisca vitripennis]